VLDRDPGLDAAVPFRFACSRCGHCCSSGSGHVWLAAGEVERLAAALGATPAAFAERHVRAVADPRTGEPRLSLREGPDGRCALLTGRNTCTVYAARPEHCRAFPYWPSVLGGGAGFEAARATCPGIAVEVPAALRERAFVALEALHRALEAEPGPPAGRSAARDCCLAGRMSEDLYVSALEADYAARRAAPAAGCRLGPARPLGCRLAGSGLERAEAWRARLRALEREVGYPAAYGEARALLRARGVALEDAP
jgi:hypothetical protein